MGTDLIKWRFIFGSDDQIISLFKSLKTPLKLTDKNSLPYVFIIDKQRNLRGRDDDEDMGTLFGFNAESVAEINNKMVDDVKVILAEYRRAWKKYNKTTSLNMKNFSYIGLFIILIVFGLLFIPKILDRLLNNTQVESNRSVPAKPLAYIKLNGEAKKVPEFLMFNQDSLLIGNEDFKGKVYLAEFFFTRCPTICPIMNKNMKILDDRFGNRQDFGIASLPSIR